jgi:hypothetical protein
LVYLDAYFAFAFDNGKGTAQEELSRNKAPRPSSSSGVTFPEAESHQGRASAARVQVIEADGKRFTNIRVPVLAICAIPRDPGPLLPRNDPALLAEAALMEKQAKAFEDGVNARVIRLPFANHNVFLSNEADVLREMRAFLATLK